jgi:diguanylate cyclase (GGDEF)-like protein
MVTVANKIQKMVSVTYKVEKHHFDTSASIGAAFYPAKNETYTGLMRHADSALYAAKSAGKNCVKIYESNERNGDS